jgi:putative MATE family efflux protein
MTRPALLVKNPVGKTITGMTVPLLGGIYAMMSFTLVDTYFVSRLGTTALAAISFTFPISMLLVYLILGIGVGTASLVSRTIGQGNHADAARFATDGLTLGILFVIFEILLGLITIDPLFTFLGAEGPVLRLIRDYMEIWYVAIGFFILSMMSNNIIRAAGDATFPGLVMIISALMNLILDPILIFGYFGLPALGIQGAALSTLIAFMMSVIALLIKQFHHYHLITFDIPSPRQCWRSWSQIIYIGVPSGLANVIVIIAIAFITRILATYDEATVAGFGIAIRIEEFFLAPFHALSGAIAPFVGQNWGSRQFDRIQQGLKLCLYYCSYGGLVLAVLLALTGKLLAQIFDTNEHVILTASLYLLIVPASYFARGIVLIVIASLNALGKPMPATSISFIRTFLLYVPLAYLGNAWWGISGIFASALAANTLTGLGAHFWNKKYLMRLIGAQKINVL